MAAEQLELRMAWKSLVCLSVAIIIVIVEVHRIPLHLWKEIGAVFTFQSSFQNTATAT